MSLQEKIADILERELYYVYCFNCKNGLDDESCGDCHRKYMNWSISHSAAMSIAQIICGLEGVGR